MPVAPSQWLSRTIILLLTSLCLSTPAISQSAVDGAIAGQVLSAEGKPIAGAEILLTGDQNTQRTVTSGRHGEFLLIRLTPGEYHLQARATGYRGVVDATATVELGQTTEVHLGHPTSDGKREHRTHATGLIGVTDLSGHKLPEDEKPAPLANDAVLYSQALDRQPVQGRDWATLALDTAQPHADPDADGQLLLTIRGLDPTENATQIDGLSQNQGFGAVPVGTGAAGREEDGATSFGPATGQGIGQGRHAGAAFTFSQSAVREFRLNEQSYSALYGHAIGGILTAVSKSGTDALHGTAFLTLRESAWGAANPFSIQTTYTDGLIASNVVKPEDQRAQFGGSVGGPIASTVLHKKLFYFAAYDQQQRNFPAISSPAYAQFYSLTATQTALLGNRGVTPAKTIAALNYLSSLTGSVPRRQDQTVAFAKFDWHVRSSNHVSVQYNRARWSSPAGATTAAVVARARASLGNNDGSVDEAMARWTTLLHHGLSNEVRLLYGRDLQYETAQPPLPQEPAIGPGGLSPEIAIEPEGLMFGTPASLGRTAYPDETRTQLTDTLAWIKGRHLLRVGVDVSRIHDIINALANQEGTFRYDSGATGGKAGGLVDWITDYNFDVHAYPNGACPSINSKVHDFCFRSFSQSFGAQTTTFDTRQLAGFLQDDWRFRPTLSLHLGIRYESQTLPTPQAPNATLDALFGKIASTSTFPKAGPNLMPRAGLAWQPRWMHGGVLRAGYGMYFGQLPGTTIRAALTDTALATSPNSTTHVRITPATETACPQVANQGFGYACAYLAAPPAAVAVTTTAAVFDRNFKLPAVQQASLALEHTVGAGFVATASFILNLDHQLPNSVDINIAPSTSTGTFQLSGGTGAIGVRNTEKFVIPLYTARVSPLYGPVTDILSNATGSYDGLVLEARRHTRSGLDLRLNWTWSKALDTAQASSGIPRTNNQFDPFAIGYDKALSSLNYPHRIVATALWTPTLHADSHLLRTAANGWEAAPIFLESSGRPYSYQIFGGPRLSGGYESINGSGGATYLPTVGRNTLRLPDSMQLNLRLSRAVPITERIHLRAAAEAFNLTNRVNYSGITQRAFLPGPEVSGITPLLFQNAATLATEGLNTQPFGAFTAAGTSEARERQLQLSLKLEF